MTDQNTEFVNLTDDENLFFKAEDFISKVPHIREAIGLSITQAGIVAHMANVKLERDFALWAVKSQSKQCDHPPEKVAGSFFVEAKKAMDILKNSPEAAYLATGDTNYKEYYCACGARVKPVKFEAL